MHCQTMWSEQALALGDLLTAGVALSGHSLNGCHFFLYKMRLLFSVYDLSQEVSYCNPVVVCNGHNQCYGKMYSLEYS